MFAIKRRQIRNISLSKKESGGSCVLMLNMTFKSYAIYESFIYLSISNKAVLFSSTVLLDLLCIVFFFSFFHSCIMLNSN